MISRNGLRLLWIFSVIMVGLWMRLNEVSAGGSKVKLMIIRKSSPDYVLVAEGLKKDLGHTYDVSELSIARETSYDEFNTKVIESRPDFLVLMDNQSVDFGLRFNKEAKAPGEKLRGIGLMGLNLPALIGKNEHFAGISYESPAYSLVTQYRYLVSSPVKTVSVFYRKRIFSERIREAREQLAKESIDLKAYPVDENGEGDDKIEEALKAGLEKLKTPGGTDAVWVLLDSALLKPKLFTEAWLPAARSLKIPFLVETEALARKDLEFGTFATTPNLPDLVGQAVQVIDSIAKDGAKPVEVGIENVISVNKLLNMSRASELGLQVKKENLQGVQVIE